MVYKYTSNVVHCTWHLHVSTYRIKETICKNLNYLIVNTNFMLKAKLKTYLIALNITELIIKIINTFI